MTIKILQRFWLVVLLISSPFAHAAYWTAHTDGVWRITYSPDGQFFVTTGGDGIARSWWSECLCALSSTTHDRPFQIYDAAFFPDNRVVSTSLDGSTYVWNHETGEKLKTLEGHALYVPKVAISPSGKTLFTLGSDETIIRWDGDLLTEVSRWRTESPGGLISLDDAGNDVITTSMDGVLRWNSMKGELKQSYTNSPYYFAIAPKDAESFFAAGAVANGATIKQIRISDGETLKEYLGIDSSVWQLALSRDGKLLGAVSYKGVVVVWNAESGSVVYTSAPKITNPLSFSFVPGANALLIGDDQGRVHVARLQLTGSAY